MSCELCVCGGARADATCVVTLAACTWLPQPYPIPTLSYYAMLFPAWGLIQPSISSHTLLPNKMSHSSIAVPQNRPIYCTWNLAIHRVYSLKMEFVSFLKKLSDIWHLELTAYFSISRYLSEPHFIFPRNSAKHCECVAKTFTEICRITCSTLHRLYRVRRSETSNRARVFQDQLMERVSTQYILVIKRSFVTWD